MVRLVNLASAVAVTAALVGCSSAPKSHEVQAKYVSSAKFSNMSCEQLIAEAENLRRTTPALAAAVDKHREQQTAVEVVTWVLFWPAAFALDKGTEYSQPLAEAKGELEAIQSSLRQKRCAG